jgi:hypothetical protein
LGNKVSVPLGPKAQGDIHQAAQECRAVASALLGTAPPTHPAGARTATRFRSPTVAFRGLGRKCRLAELYDMVVVPR